MPYSLENPASELVEKIKKRHPAATTKDVRQFIHIFNNCAESAGEDESGCFARAWGVLKKKFEAGVIAELDCIADELERRGDVYAANAVDELSHEIQLADQAT
jgi:hypothetical protein